MSLYIDMKMIPPGNSSGSDWFSVIMFWISAKICNVVNPEKSVHSNSIGSPSIQSNSRHWDEFINQSIFLLSCAHRISTDSSHAQNWIGEDEGFSLLITEMLGPSTESSLSKMVHSLNFCLFADQLHGYIEQWIYVLCGWFLVECKLSK